MSKNIPSGKRSGLPKKSLSGPLFESRELLLRVFESLDDALFIVDSKTRTVLGCNPAVEKIFGYGPEEIIGRTTELLHLTRRMFLEFHRISLPALEEKGIFRTEYRMRRRDGSVFVSEHAVTRVTEPGKPLVVVSLVRDVTESRGARELLQVQRDLALALSEAKGLQETLRLSLAAALQLSGLECGGIYLRDDRDGSLQLACHRGLSPSFVRAASRYEAESGNTRLVMEGRSVYGNHPDMKLALSRSEQREGVQALAVIPICHEKQVIACLNLASRKTIHIPPPSRTALETIASQIGMSIRRVRAEEGLRNSERQYARAENLAHVGHWERDHAQQEASWSPEVFRIFGRNPKDGVPSFAEFLNRVHPEDRELLLRELESVRSPGARPEQPRQFEYRIIRPDGTVRDVLTTLESVLGPDGRASKMIGTLQDITKTKTLQNQIVSISKAERESLQRDLHDTVGQQLTGLAFLAEEIKQELVQHPEQAARDLEKLIEINQTALEQAKEITRGLTPLTDEPRALEFSLRELARKVSLIYKIPCRYVSTSRISLTNAEVSTQLYLIAREAAINAAKHARARLIRISLAPKGKAVRLRVTDDGRGMDPEKKLGKGLGLYAMKQRAALIDAQLRIFSGKKGGTIVECTRKLRPAEQDGKG